MAVSYVNIIFFNSQKSFSFLSNAPYIIKLKFQEIKNTVRVPSRMKITKNSVFLHYFSKFMGIFLFVLKYKYISLLLKMINGFSWPAKIMASPFKAHENHCFLYPTCIRIFHLHLRCWIPPPPPKKKVHYFGYYFSFWCFRHNFYAIF